MSARQSIFTTASLALVLAGCAVGPHARAGIAPGADPLTTCPKSDPCSKVADRRQYFDQRVNRYYYFDRTTGRYYWENGQPRFPEDNGL